MKVQLNFLIFLVLGLKLIFGSEHLLANSFDANSNARNSSRSFELYSKGVTYTSSGSSMRGSDGSVWMMSGSTIIGHGKSYVKSGHTITGQGVSFTLSGNTIRGNNGVTCVVSGPTTRCT